MGKCIWNCLKNVLGYWAALALLAFIALIVAGLLAATGGSIAGVAGLGAVAIGEIVAAAGITAAKLGGAAVLGTIIGCIVGC